MEMEMEMSLICNNTTELIISPKLCRELMVNDRYFRQTVVEGNEFFKLLQTRCMSGEDVGLCCIMDKIYYHKCNYSR